VEPTTPRPSTPGPRRLAIWELCLLVAGVAFGLWLFAINKEDPGVDPFAVLIGVLGGASVIGPPILLWERRRRRKKWGPGEVMWFAEGMSAWLLWPPAVIHRIKNAPPGPDRAMGAACFAYGTPLMALWVGSALLCGGWIRRRGRRRRRMLSWRERFGLILSLLWACTGGWVLYLIYGPGLR
jgi:hypothetical protein